MNEEKKAWLFECKCGRRFVSHVPAIATCTRHDRPVTLKGEEMPYADAMSRICSVETKAKKKKKKKATPEQLTLF